MVRNVDVVIYGKAESLGLLSDGLAKEKGARVIYKTSSSTDLKARLDGEDEEVVVLVSCLYEPPDVIAEIVIYLKEHNRLFICISPDAKEGFDMLKRGASDMAVYIKSGDDEKNRTFFYSLASKIKSLRRKYIEDNRRELKYPDSTHFNKIIAIGSSTGGTETVIRILQSLPGDTPPILIVQHMPAVFTRLYATRMNQSCKMSVWEAKDGDILRPGLALLAPGDFHMTLVKKDDQFAVRCQEGERVHNQCPAVDVLFESVAREAGRMAVGVILTGMGSDGAKGLLEMRKSGSVTIGQDEETCVVYGMPKAAYEIGAVQRQVPLDKVAEVIMESVYEA